MTEQDLREKEREIEKNLQLLFVSIHNYRQAKIEYRKNKIATISNNVIESFNTFQQEVIISRYDRTIEALNTKRQEMIDKKNHYKKEIKETKQAVVENVNKRVVNISTNITNKVSSAQSKLGKIKNEALRQVREKTTLDLRVKGIALSAQLKSAEIRQVLSTKKEQVKEYVETKKQEIIEDKKKIGRPPVVTVKSFLGKITMDTLKRFKRTAKEQVTDKINNKIAEMKQTHLDSVQEKRKILESQNAMKQEDLNMAGNSKQSIIEELQSSSLNNARIAAKEDIFAASPSVAQNINSNTNKM
ncbi:MAG TPA: hypothetical protein IAB45_02585 [Candidatus Onthousia faecavium]|nr:hypothetical protein [Candidatus Onthousia faecavium]